MKSDRLSRKTYLKKNYVRPEGEITVYDFTISEPDACREEALYLHNFRNISGLQNEDIDSLPYVFETQEDILSWCAALMGQSPTASALWNYATAEGWRAGIADLHSSGFHIDIPNRILWLDHFGMNPHTLGRSIYFRNTLLTTLIRALRDIWHEQRMEAFETQYAPEDVLMLERVRAADCDTVTVLSVWELRGAGHAEIWRHLIGSSEGDMAMMFTKFLERDPAALFSGTALTYTFRQWYADESRVDGSDHETLEALDDILLDATERNPFGARKLEAKTLESLACLPDGRCYLTGLGDTIRTDPYFAGLQDEINQTHLFQLIYDMEVTMVNNVPFRDRALARKFFPQEDKAKT